MNQTHDQSQLGKKEGNIIGIKNPDKPIYRIFTLDRLLDTIVGKKLAFVRPRLWKDPFENLLYQIPLKDADGEPVSVERLRDRLYGQCWTRKSVSDALWRIYSPHETGIRVRTTPRKLFNAIWDKNDSASHLKYFIGAVRYESQKVLLKQFQDPQMVTAIVDETGRNPVESLLLKRTAYRHENEVRVIFQSGDDVQSEAVFFSIDPNVIFESLLFDPRMDRVTVATFTNILRRYGFKNRISQSTLYTAPTFRSQTI